MPKIYFLSAPDKHIHQWMDYFNAEGFSCRRSDSLFELKKYCNEEKPALIFAVNNLKEKKIAQVLYSLQKAPETAGIPVIGITVTDNPSQAVLEFLRNGAVDALNENTVPEEAVLRAKLRIDEAVLRSALTPNEFFFSEAQEKEQGKRSGIFHFFNNQRVAVGSVYIKDGRVVHATYGSIIKEDAFLQLACNDNLSFRFEDRADIEDGTFSASITNLLLEAYKLKDEMKKQGAGPETELKGLIIDPNRIERLLANRVLKNMGIESKVVSDTDFTLRLMTGFLPNFIIVDCGCAESVLDRIWPEGRRSDNIPVIIYCDEEIKNLNSSFAGNHQIDKVVWKKDFQTQMKNIVRNLFNTAPVKHEEA